jgi:very-short-patch-repair endonuclease
MDYTDRHHNFDFKITKQRMSANYPDRKTGKIRDVPTVCSVCGAPFMSARATHAKRQHLGYSPVCSPECHGVRAAMLTPKRDTSIEKVIEFALLDRAIVYQKQVPLCGITVVDFLLPDYRFVIYCDGTFWHADEDAKRRDARQNQILTAHGYTVFRFSEADITRSPSECLDRLPLTEVPPFLQLAFPLD